jgi:hypothetical protein
MANLVAIQMQGLDFHTHGRAAWCALLQRDTHGVFGGGIDRVHSFANLLG